MKSYINSYLEKKFGVGVEVEVVDFEYWILSMRLNSSMPSPTNYYNLLKLEFQFLSKFYFKRILIYSFLSKIDWIGFEIKYP